METRVIEDILTPNELQIAYLLADGYGYAEIGKRVGMGAQSVKNRLSKIYRKLGLIERGRRPAILLTRLVVKDQMDDR